MLTKPSLLSQQPICVQFALQLFFKVSIIRNSNLSLDVDQAAVLCEESAKGVKEQLGLHADVDLHRLAGRLHPVRERRCYTWAAAPQATCWPCSPCPRRGSTWASCSPPPRTPPGPCGFRSWDHQRPFVWSGIDIRVKGVACLLSISYVTSTQLIDYVPQEQLFQGPAVISH